MRVATEENSKQQNNSLIWMSSMYDRPNTEGQVM